MADTHLVLYPRPHQWIVLPAHLQHTSQRPFLHRWHLHLSTQTHNLTTSAQIRHWCLSWMQMAQPTMEVIGDSWETLHYTVCKTVFRLWLTSTARVALEELCRMWKRRVLPVLVWPSLRYVPPLWMIIGLPLNRLIRWGGSWPCVTRTWAIYWGG